jgi:O-antigen/teichoic acid export membrane protein
VIARLKRSPFAMAALALAGGTAMAQAVPILVSPVLTRLYTPHDFGQLSLFTALVSSVGMAASGRYDMAMLLPRRWVPARHLFGLAVWVSAAFCAAYMLLLLIAPAIARGLLGAEGLGGWLYVVPFALFVTAARTTLGYWANRAANFRALVKAQWVQTVLAAVISLTLGAAGSGFAGLLLGNIAGVLGAALMLLLVFRGEFGRPTLAWTRSKAALARRFRDYPLYSASSAIVDGVTLTLPVFFLAHHFPASTLGYYALVVRVANAPLSFVSSAVAQVNLKKVVQLLHERASVPAHLVRLSAFLALFAAVPALILFATAPWLFGHLFGPAWEEAGSYLQILMPSLAVRFVGTTLSGTMEATNNTRIGAAWKVLALVVTALVMLVLAPRGDIRALLIGVAVSDTLLYLLYTYLCFYAGARPRLAGT